MKHFDKVFKREYWHSNIPEIVESRFKFIGLIIALLISLLLYVTIKMADNRWNKRISKITNEANKKQDYIKSQLDSARIINLHTQRKIYELEGSLSQDSVRQSLLNKKLNDGINQIKKINEKNYIPAATINQQLDFISTVKYEEYSRN